MKRVIFLDIDGVLCSMRSAAALGGYPSSQDPTSWNRFDPVAIALLQAAVKKSGAGVVLTSSWRHEANAEALEYRLGVKIHDATRSPRAIDCRGAQIDDWLTGNPGTEAFAIIDDDEDFLPYQMEHLALTSKRNGFLLSHYETVLGLLGVGPREE